MKKYTSEFKKNLSIAYPVMLGQLGHVLVGFADNLMVGKLGAASLAAVSLANGFIFTFVSLGIGFTFSITTLTAEAEGEKNVEKGSQIFSHGFLLASFIGVLITIALFFAKPLLYYMKQPDEVVQLAKPYYDIVAFSIIPAMIFQGIKQFADGLSLTKYAMRATIIANLFNVLFNYILIYGFFGFPKLGIDGAAVGTLLSRFIMLGLMIFYLRSDKKLTPYLQQFSFSNIKKKVVLKIIDLGYPTALQFWFEVNLFVAAIFLSGVLGTNAQAANQIALNLASMTFMIATGLGVASTIRVGYQKGLKNYNDLRRIALSTFLLMAIVAVFFAIIFILCKNFLPSLYVDDTEVIKTASILIVISGFFQLSDGVQAVVLGALRGLQDVKIPMLIAFISYWIIGFPTSYYLSMHTSLKSSGIWIGLLVSLTASAIMLYLRFNYLTKKLISTNQ